MASKANAIKKLRAAGIPDAAIKALYEMYAANGDDVLTHPDPQVTGTFALRIRKACGKTIDLLLVRWTAEFDEVEWETWPPKSGSLKFFV
jgi:hypothetical protein